MKYFVLKNASGMYWGGGEPHRTTSTKLGCYDEDDVRTAGSMNMLADTEDFIEVSEKSNGGVQE